MIPLAFFLGFAILMMGSDILAIQAGFAQRLDLPGAWIISWMPMISTGLFALAVFTLRRAKRFRWAGLFLAYLLAQSICLSTLSFYQKATTAIILPAQLNKESVVKFDAAYPVKHAYSPSSRSEVVLRVRREDYSEAMAQFAKELVEHQGNEYP